MCFTRRNTLFHQRKHSVSSRETLCFTKGNRLETLPQISETSLQISQVLLSRCLVDLLSFEISFCDFATFARGKSNSKKKDSKSNNANFVVGKRCKKRKLWRINYLFNLLEIRIKENKIRI